MKQIWYILTFVTTVLMLSGCITSRIDHYSEYTPKGLEYHRRSPQAVDEYYFLSWEPYHFIVTLGIVPQYHYVVYETDSGEFEKHTTMIGWLAIPMPLFPSWKFGHIPEEKQPNQHIDFTVKTPVE